MNIVMSELECQIEQTKVRIREAVDELTRIRSKMDEFIDWPLFNSVPPVVAKAAEIERLMARLATETQSLGIMRIRSGLI